MYTLSKTTLRRLKRRDKVARWVVTLGGVVVIGSVTAMLVLIVATVLPLFRAPRVRLLAEQRLPASLAAKDVAAVGLEMGVDEKLLVAHVLQRNGSVKFIDLHGGQVLASSQLFAPREGAPSNGTVRTIARIGPAAYSLIWSDGTISLVEMAVQTAASHGAEGKPLCTVRTRATIPPEKGSIPVRAVLRASKDKEGSVTCAALLPDNHILLLRREEDLSGEIATKSRTLLSSESPARIGPIALAAVQNGIIVYAGTADGGLLWWKVDNEGQVVDQETVPAFHDKRAVLALSMLLGDMSLAVGDAGGEVSTWCFVRTDSDSSRKLRLIHKMQPHAAAVRQIIPSERSKALLSFDEQGVAALDYMTDERRLATIAATASNGSPPLVQVGLSSRADALVGLDAQGNLKAWHILCLHPEISWQTLFGKVQYEGYDEPDYVWQTTGGDDYEPKMSLVPLLFGTFKATLYAMLFAGPLALAAAAYVSHFTTPAFKQWIKPIVEIMAALPSVVIGFVVALWLAPIVERRLVALLLALLSVPAALLAFLLVWQVVRSRDWARRIAHGREFLLLVPILIVGIGAAIWAAPWLERALPGGNATRWLGQYLHLGYDQRNSIIVAFGLGFAVIPIIFSLAEDALSNVPHSMTAASMALGASRWQTLWRVVLPSASPGIFAAVMIGFGRAVGETMIILMATGCTPLMDWNPFNGMRTLAANIAMEIPEAPVPDLGSPGTLYRVLFLCAVLLFVLTFALNTVAEVVRQRLRKRYGQY
jgi:phosphate transport system permease protein